MSSLKGHRALVTGATQGVGRAIAVALARAGADVVLHGLRRDTSAEQTQTMCATFGVQVAIVEGDLASHPVDAAERLFLDASAVLPGIDLLVNNAGTCIDTMHFLDVTPEIFERTLRLNVQAPFFLTQRFARQWVEEGTKGRVLFTGSINGRLAESNHAAYDTSKGAVEMMVKTLCVALAPRGIRVNGMAPGLVRTPLTESFLSDPKAMAWMQMHTPNGAVPGADACGEAAAFLLGDAAWHIHGQMLLVDGGMSAWQQPDPPAG
jgi:glucose 1-dehydrogenase